MRIALASLTRPALLAGLIATGSAIGVARLAPGPAPGRVERPETHILVSPHGVEPGAPGTLWLDKETGRTTLVPPTPAWSLQHASVSPWADESGQSQMVGRFAVRPGDPSPEAVGLVRTTFPDGRVIDLVATEVPLAGRPCWYPGRGARVLFAGGDGVLYQHDFEPADPLSAPGPRPIEWLCPKPGVAEVLVAEPTLPSDPRMARTLVLCLRHKRPDGRLRNLMPAELWWLRLSPDGDAIEAAGPLLGPGAAVEDSDARSPAVGRALDGGLAVAYFSSVNTVDWDLMIAPLTLDETGRPSVAPGSPSRLAQHCRPGFAPGFSGDGRWISAVQLDPTGRGTILRLDLADRASPDPSIDPPTLPAGRPARGGKWSILTWLIQALLGIEGCP
jgi:hypothetical protein